MKMLLTLKNSKINKKNLEIIGNINLFSKNSYIMISLVLFI